MKPLETREPLGLKAIDRDAADLYFPDSGIAGDSMGDGKVGAANQDDFRVSVLDGRGDGLIGAGK